MRKGQLLTSLVLVVTAALFAVLMRTQPDAALLRHAAISEGMRRLGITDAGWQTVAIVSVRDTSLPRASVFAAWSRLEEWPKWGAPLYAAASWVDAPGWAVGGRFRQTLDLGFPLSRLQRIEVIGTFEAGQSASWWDSTSAVAVHQSWSFEDLPQGGTRVTVTQICHGIPVGLIRFLIQNSWQHRFDQALDGLVLAARRGTS